MGDETGVQSLYSILLLFLMEKRPIYQQNKYHKYLSEEPVFVCKSYFSLMMKYSKIYHE